MEFMLKNSSVSLGKFDGIHKGHRCLLKKIKEKKGLVSTVFTFEGGNAPKIYTQDEKNIILESLGVEREILFPFNEKTKLMSPADFIEEILVKRMDAKFICVGEDFRFGRDRSGDVHTLQKYQDRFGYELCIVKKLTYVNEIISSTKIREYLKEGNIELANIFLDEEYFIRGKVLSGEEIGRKISSPTANILTENDKILPRFGVYASLIQIDKNRYFGVSNVGVKPTIGTFPAGIETNIFDFHENIYGKEIQVHLCKFLREEQKFSTIEALKEQIVADKNKALKDLQNMYQGYTI